MFSPSGFISRIKSLVKVLVLKNAQETLILQFPPSSPYSCANKGLEAIKQKHRKCILVPSNSVVEVCKKCIYFFLT